MVYRVLSLLLGRTWPTCCGQIPWARAAVLGVEAPPIRSCVAISSGSSEETVFKSDRRRNRRRARVGCPCRPITSATGGARNGVH